jgi:hypothetical protein
MNGKQNKKGTRRKNPLIPKSQALLQRACSYSIPKVRKMINDDPLSLSHMYITSKFTLSLKCPPHNIVDAITNNPMAR